MMIYHYTKCNRLSSIFNDEFIATEMSRTLSPLQSHTDFVWLTEKQQYPKTALPLITSFPETSLVMHLTNKNIHVDLDKIGQMFGSFYRFSFDSKDERLKKWWFSEQRKTKLNCADWMRMESVANKVGDDVRSFWISTQNLNLENFSLEVHEDGIWKKLLTNTSMSRLNPNEKAVIKHLIAASNQKCVEFNLPLFEPLKMAA